MNSSNGGKYGCVTKSGFFMGGAFAHRQGGEWNSWCVDLTR